MRQGWRWSVTMDTRYDVISSKWSSHFWVKMHVFQLLLLLDKMMQSNYLCVVLLVKRKKLSVVTVFTWFSVLEKMQDGDHVWWRHRPPAVPPRIKYTSSCREGHRLSTEGKIEIRELSINPQPDPPPPHPPSHRTTVRVSVKVCMTLRVRPRVKPAYNSEWTNGEKFGMGLLIIKSTCFCNSSRMRGTGVSAQQFSSLQGNKISVQTKYAI